MSFPPRISRWLLALLPLAMCNSGKSDDLPHGEFFEKQVRPILVARCQSCHGEKKQEFGLRLDSRASLLTGGDDGAVVVEGKPDESKIIQAIRYGGDVEMPPKGKISDEEIAVLTRWVELGLPWPNDGAEIAKSASGEELYRYEREHLWSLQPIQRRPLPKVKNANWSRSPLDVYVLAKLEAAGLSPAPEADRRTLIRRAKFDLLGLPPTPEEVEAFEKDDAPDAYEQLIDRLLAAPAYGERWGRHWLDVARYADTRGYAFGKERKFPYAYTYRDWVIAAFNDDLPYDQFVTQQLAADLLPDNPARQHAALGFLTVGRKFNNDHDDIDDQIDVVTRGFLGLTVACARCHDHKYDAIATEDYYSLYGVFASSTEPDERPLIGSPEESAGYDLYKTELDKRQQTFDQFVDAKHKELLDVGRRNVAEYLIRATAPKPEDLAANTPGLSLNADELKPGLITRWRQYLGDNVRDDHSVWKALVLGRVGDGEFTQQLTERLAGWKDLPADRFNPLVRQALIDHPPANKIELARLYGDLISGVYETWHKTGANDEARAKLSIPQQQLLAELLADGSPTNVPRDELRGYLIRADKNRFSELQKAVQSHMANSPAAPARAMSLVDKSNLFEPQVFIRGNHHRRGKRVPRQFVRLIAGDDRQPFTNGSGRLELAQAIVAPTNPLTPRVIANRVWMHHFGQPLVATPSDFGMRSEPPVQLDVLDYLADHLMNNGWSLKDLHREIMLSATYRQGASTPTSTDPENQLLAHANRRRLEFEPLRDAMLSLAGRLDATMYGRPADIFTEVNNPRRGVYAYIDRQDLPNLLRAFDFPSPDQSAERRPNTTVPQQALFLMNSPFVIQQAQAVAARGEIMAEDDPANRVANLYRLIFTRAPSDAELAVGVEFIAAAESNKAGGDQLNAWEQYVQILLLTNEFMFVD